VLFVALPMPQASFSIPPPSHFHFHFLCSVIPTPQKGNKGVKDRSMIVVTSEHDISVRVWLNLTNEKYTHTCVLKLPLLVDLQQKIGELVLSINSCPSTIILEKKL
jgi:hypothetical protein